jgi:hypothetical protein
MTVVLPKGPFVVAPHPAVGANRREPASGVPGKQAYPQYVGRPQALHHLFALLERYPDRRFAAYGAEPAHIAAMRKRFNQWREQLLTDES